MRCSWPCRDMGSENIEWPCTYRIRLEGELPSNWPDRLGRMGIAIELHQGGRPVTVLQCSLMDEEDLSAVLETLYGMHLLLLSMEAVETREQGARVFHSQVNGASRAR